MTAFTEIYQQLDWHELMLQINSKYSQEVEKAIYSDKLSLNDFMALISPAAYPYLEVIVQKAQKLTRQRFGNTVGLYVPLYLSNLCANDCTYCGGEHPTKVSMDYLANIPLIRKYFSSLLIEVQPLTTAEYLELKKLV